MKTRILTIQSPGALGSFRKREDGTDDLSRWDVSCAADADTAKLAEAADWLRKQDTPVGFPTETVYGSGQTRRGARRSAASTRPRAGRRTTPLIVHVCDLEMLTALLRPDGAEGGGAAIPAIYGPLIERFWPGPLTILLPNPRRLGWRPR